MTAQLQWHAPKISPFWWPVDLSAAPIAPAPPAIGAPRFRAWNERTAALNRRRVAACKGRGEHRRVGELEYGGELLTLLVDHDYLTEAEANSYDPDPAARRRFNDSLRRATTALIEDILSGRIGLIFPR
jgi:hypothetical protein